MGLKVLVVDDSHVMRMMVVRNLRLAGFAVDLIIEACDGEDALKKFAGSGVDVILSDLHMPNMDGHQLARKIREISASIPILLITAEGSQTKLSEAMDAGISAYLNKPPTPDELGDKLRSILPH